MCARWVVVAVQGTHDELMATPGSLYASLVASSQLQGDRPASPAPTDLQSGAALQPHTGAAAASSDDEAARMEPFSHHRPEMVVPVVR